MKRLMLFAVVASFAASVLPASAGQTVDAQVVNGASGYTQSPNGYGFAYGLRTLGVTETSGIPPAGPPTVGGPTTMLASIVVCTATGCDSGFSQNATGNVPLDPTLSGGTVTVTVPSALYTGGTLTATFTYIGFGQYSENHTGGGGGNNVDPSGPQLSHNTVVSAGVYRQSLLAISSFSSSTIGGISGSGFGSVFEGGYVSVNANN